MSKRSVGKLSRDYKPVESEEKILRWWKTSRAYEKTKKRLIRKRKFYFLDGPPYVTNPPHVGTAWNKTLKDVLIRFWRMRGYNVHDQPGYDCHGLPIEVMVEKKLNLSSKKDIEQVIGIDRFVAECKKYADENVGTQTQIFSDLGIWMDWENPYITYQDSYIESVWWTVKQAERKHLLYKGVKVVHWCPHDETALAGYEVTDEYRIIKDYSIFVKFPVVDRPGEFLLIWTTTPWTLPANLGVMVHPEKTYTRVEVDGEILTIAKERLAPVLGERTYRILDEFQGAKLEGVSYRPPLLEETGAQTGGKLYRIVLSSEYVSMTEGTGLVHMAPGHGEEDYEVGQRYRLPVFSPVDQAGRFTQEAGKYAGLGVRDANPVIIRDLESKKLLFREEIIEHSYPHCWRCKTPLILRAADQWFFKITAFKQRMIQENKKAHWTPDWAGSKRFHDWLLGARDWVISRQRYWGAPLPVWTCQDCGKRAVVASRSELLKLAVSPPKRFDLHRNGVDQILIKCPRCGGKARREPDILDVWLDAGVASWASLGYPPNLVQLRAWWPADAIIEAHDQTRGWFYNQLGSSVLVFNKSPFKSVLMHGHTLDPKGEKISKSSGNFTSPGEIIAKYGRDALRFYTLQATVWEDFRFSWSTLEAVARDLQIIWNVFAFATLYMNLDKFSPSEWPPRRLSRSYRSEDKWLLSKTEGLVEKVTDYNERMEFHESARALREFAIENLSHWYVRLVRRRFWQERNSPDKLAAYSALYHALATWLSLAAPMIPFVTETIYRDSFRAAHRNGLDSIHMAGWPKMDKKWANKRLEEEMRIAQHISEAAASARQSKKMKLRQPVSKILVVSDMPAVKGAVKTFLDLLLQQTNAKQVGIVSVTEAEQLKRLTVEPNFKTLGPAFRGEANRIAEALRKQNGLDLSTAFKQSGHFRLGLDNEYKVTSEMVTLKEEMPENYAVGDFGEGRVYVDTTIPSDLVREGFVREVIRRLQEMRKRLNLPVDAFVDTFILMADADKLDWLEDEKETVMGEVRAKSLLLLRPGETKPKLALSEDWRIEGQDLHMGMSQVLEVARRISSQTIAI